jgi:hypothetical protein
MLQVDPPPKAVKVTMSKRIPLVGDELKAYEEEQERIKKEEAIKASLVKKEELKASQGSNAKASDPMDIDSSSSRKSTKGMLWLDMVMNFAGQSPLERITHLEYTCCFFDPAQFFCL